MNKYIYCYSGETPEGFQSGYYDNFGEGLELIQYVAYDCIASTITEADELCKNAGFTPTKLVTTIVKIN